MMSFSGKRWFSMALVVVGAVATGCGDDAETPHTAQEGPGGTGGAPSAGNGGAAGDGDGATGGQGASGGGSDDIPAFDVAVKGTFPEDGATAVLPDAVIEIEFNQPMDAGATQAAYTSVDLPAELVVFDWSEDQTVLRIIPKDGLDVDSGPVLEDLLPTGYALRIETSARSLVGSTLPEPLVLDFSTARRLELTLPVVEAASGSVSDNGFAMGTMWIGDNPGNDRYIAVATFDGLGLPEGVLGFDGADFRAKHVVASGNPYDKLGALEVYAASFIGMEWSQVQDDVEAGAMGIASQSAATDELVVDVRDYVTGFYFEADPVWMDMQLAFAFTTIGSDDGLGDNVYLNNPSLELGCLVP